MLVYYKQARRGAFENSETMPFIDANPHATTRNTNSYRVALSPVFRRLFLLVGIPEVLFILSNKNREYTGTRSLECSSKVAGRSEIDAHLDQLKYLLRSPNLLETHVSVVLVDKEFGRVS